jgi:hypothetical protein
MAQDDVEVELRSFCVLGLASKCAIACGGAAGTYATVWVPLISIGASIKSSSGGSLLSRERRDDPYRVDDTGHIPQYRQQDIDPKVLGQSYLQKYSQRGNDDREHDP